MEYVRKPTVAGMFYPADKKGLINEIEHCFLTNPGPLELPIPSDDESSVFGVIVPHAGYSCSGGIAAHAYKTIRDAGLFDVFIILGPNHNGIGSRVALSPHDSWQTPLGTTSVDPILKKSLLGGIIELDDLSYRYQENSVEVQLPFLQYIYSEQSFSIAPIVMAMQDHQTSQKTGEQIAKIIKKDGRRICVIASTDFSHEGIGYGRMPPKELQVDEFARRQDSYAIEKILQMDSIGLFDVINEKEISMCGYGPVIALLSAAKFLDKTTVELLKYGTSYDLYPDSNACVGYGAFAIR
ncbi:MAG: AmmeMemoRadiSam system protein B [Candidatus Thermoplasmatota archaeon]|nr:AmmeMemoRadiSam system protein B [Candidatus Thermoplasmatota archaeon]